MTIHLCAWPACAVQVPNSMLCCGRHWRNLPYAIRNDITRHYRMGQSVATWSSEYRAAIERFKQYANAAAQIREHYNVPVLFNPYTGEPRDVRDVQSDPRGILIVPPGAELIAALAAPGIGAEPSSDFDAWQANPYTKVLQKSIEEDYVPRGAPLPDTFPGQCPTCGEFRDGYGPWPPIESTTLDPDAVYQPAFGLREPKEGS